MNRSKLGSCVAIALASSAQPSAAQERSYERGILTIDDGFCAGLAWITLLPGEKVTVDTGPDFFVYRVQGPGDREWGAYWGFAGQSGPDRRRTLVNRDAVPVFRGTDANGAFNGYFVGNERQQNHFFASFFTDDASDAAFFDRVELGERAKAKCEEYHAID